MLSGPTERTLAFQLIPVARACCNLADGQVRQLLDTGKRKDA